MCFLACIYVVMAHTSRTIHRNLLLYSQALPPSQTKLAPTPSLLTFLSSCHRRFATKGTPSSRLLPLSLTLPFPPILVCTAAIPAIAAVSLLIFLLSSRFTAASKPSQVHASAVAAADAVVLLLPPSYHKPSLRRRRRCHLVAAVSTESSSYHRRL